MIEINIRQIKNGYIYKVEGSVKEDGEFVVKNTEEFNLLERIGEILLGYKIKVDRR